jgi:hypothetical protein
MEVRLGILKQDLELEIISYMSAQYEESLTTKRWHAYIHIAFQIR